MKARASASPPLGRLLIFDLDGTLIDSVGDLTTAVNRLRADFQLAPLPTSTVRRYVGDGVRKLVERSLQGHPTDLEAALKTYRGYYAHHMHDTTALFPGVAAGLKQLRTAGWQLALISNKSADFCRALLAHLGVAELFCCVLGDGDTAQLKPDPEPLLEAMRRAGTTPAETWMIGDHHTDLEAARRAGVRSAFVTYGLGETGTDKPDHRCADFAAVVEFFTA
ncbi:MAG: HAD-IIIA family hydrolase [Kiritimatiellaeota bacterium]|nr:HAD-IIIA family hydrolase [Kiritimatiellota bacterium]